MQEFIPHGSLAVRPVGMVHAVGKGVVSVFIAVDEGDQAEGLEVVGAGNRPRLFASLAQGWQEHRRQNGDDSDDDQELNQGE